VVVASVREINSDLNAYLRMIKAGEVVLIADRGEVVAELRRPGAASEPTEFPRLNALIREGAVRLGRAHAPPDLYEVPDGLSLPAGTARAILDELRGERRGSSPSRALS
jgi:antitoxin (DNA-binding transcriptional repressor) of toxin-antitoxin stability system